LILIKRREERGGVPGVAVGGRKDVGEVRSAQSFHAISDHVLRIERPPVDGDDYQRSFGNLGAGVDEGQGAVGILFRTHENSFA
jgi:hypothetical protein